MKPIQADMGDVQRTLASRIADLEVQLAYERTAKNAIMKYAEELEARIEELTGESRAEEDTPNGRETEV